VSTVVLTLVVVGGSIAVAAKLAARGELKPATVAAPPHRARTPKPEGRRRRQPGRAAATPGGVAAVEVVAPRPGLLTRLRAGLTLVVVVAVIGGAIAVGLLVGADAAGRILEDAVK
jgi:hypothetical protein